MKVHIYLRCSVTLLRSWGNSKDVWLNILKKENRYAHCKHFTSLHSSLQPHMRSILLDWLLEVCSFSYLVLCYACEAGRCKQSFYIKDSITKCPGNAQTSLQQRGYNYCFWSSWWATFSISWLEAPNIPNRAASNSCKCLFSPCCITAREQGKSRFGMLLLQ